ncbi:hypothetical protein LTS18_003049 [Coniosporium uncinatum]|uniref:Uncharacterized protein n=1 Tax=Coniosporium uncinatum TaxID=93489 RepID=A0ACC3DTZ7_9PEZI|nr:hypothetical protein LTS18_003049 [Coniosporium uncinatum]
MSLLKPLNLLLAAAALFITVQLYQRLTLHLARRKIIREHGCKPPPRFPYKDRLFGLDLMRLNFSLAKEHKLMESFYMRFQDVGNTMAAQLFTTPTLSTIEPENIKTVLSLKFKDYGIVSRQISIGPLLGEGIFTTDGEQWAHSRQLIRPNFTRDQVADIGAFEKHVQDLFKAIPRDGSTVDLQELFFRLTIDSATEFLFGHSVDSLKMTSDKGGPDEKNFTWAFNYAQDKCATKFRMGSFLTKYFYRDETDSQAIKICHNFVDRFVEDAVQFREKHGAQDLEKKGGGDEPYVFLHHLAQSTTNRLRLRSELLNVLLAGRDTTASLLSNLFFQLAQRPDLWSKLQSSVAHLDGQPPTYDELRNLKFVKYCLNESLRMHPVVPGNSRTALTDTVLPLGGGPDGRSPVFVPKGTIVGYNVYSMHRRSDFYGADALEFKPERWETLRPGWEYLPFNGGPRICLGQQYALTEAGYVVVRMLQEFGALESRADEDGGDGRWRESLTLTMCSYGGTKVVVREK